MKRTELLRHVLADCYCRLQPSLIHGIGVYAIRDIPKGKNPFEALPTYGRRRGYVRITDEELDALPLRRQLQKFQSSNIDQVILLFEAGKNSHQHICESLELFAKEVMPEFHAAESDHHEWKRKVLAGEIELEEIDTTAFKERYGPESVQVAPTEKNMVTA
jgi:hypothetical protein